MTKYKVGDKVVLKKDLVEEETYGNERFVWGMHTFKGKIVTIKSVDETSDLYRLVEIGYNWTDGMIEGLVNKYIVEIV